MHTRRTTCRGCGSSELQPFLDLGATPLANAFPRSPNDFDSEQAFPLEVHYCSDCALVQLVDVIDPAVLFHDYIYVSGTSESVSNHFRSYSAKVVERLRLDRDDLVVDIASNDGTLLSSFKQHDVRTVGVEPAANIAQLANKRGIPTVCDFFSGTVAEQLLSQFGSAKAITANNVLAHVDEPVVFLQACNQLLARNGRVIVEVPYLGHLIERLEYDTIYHEHLSYFSATALATLFRHAGLSIEEIELVPIHGGSLRIWASSEQEQSDHARAVHRLIEEERERGLAKPDRFKAFAEQVGDHRRQMQKMLRDLSETATVAGYAAPAKGNTLLNYCQITTEELPYIVDRNPWKVGRFTPGTHIPVLGVEQIQERRPDYLLILAWNMAEEIMRQQSEFQQQGGRFVVPIPEPRVVAKENCE